MTPGEYSFSIVRGTTAPFTARLQDPDVGDTLIPTPYTSIILTLSKKETDGEGDNLILRKTTGDSGVAVSEVEGATEFVWTPTAAESRLIPVGEKTFYELEVRNGASQLVYLKGKITGVGGINSDA